MAPHLGKRKRITREELEEASRSPTPETGSGSSGSEEEEGGADIHDIFRRAFEAKFKPLEVEKKKLELEKEDEVLEDEEEESDWSGISDEDEEAHKIEVVDVSQSHNKNERMSKAEMRAFMSSKPPTSVSSTTLPLPSKAPASNGGDPLESSHLKNDAALQRLLRDSHLLSANAKSLTNPNLTLTGSLRHKSTDLHLQSLGAKTSIHAQKSMPMSHRKGISAKSQEREMKRRTEAKEAGIVLEKEVRKKKGGGDGERDRGLGAPSVGKFRGGMLTLSKKDVRDITGGGGGRERGKGKAKKGRR